MYRISFPVGFFVFFHGRKTSVRELKNIWKSHHDKQYSSSLLLKFSRENGSEADSESFRQHGTDGKVNLRFCLTRSGMWKTANVGYTEIPRGIWMDKNEKITKDYYVVDLAYIVRAIWQKKWILVTVSLILAAIGFSLAAFVIAPTYSASVMLYVNNSSFTMGDLGFSISSSELTAAQSLAKTYTVLLKNRTTLERLIDETGVDYTWEDVYDMIQSGPVNETEVMSVTVTCKDPYEAEKIANGIAVVLPQRVAEIVEGASMEVVDSAIADTQKVGPSITMYTIVGFLLGAIISIVVMIIMVLLDNTIHDEEYVIKTYNYPILAKIPDLLDAGTRKYGYYYKEKSE